MSDTTVVHNRNGTAEREFARRPTASWRRQVLSALSWRNISAVYVLIAIVLIFSATIPDKFLTATTWRTLLDNQAVTGVAAVALVVPLAAGVFNLAIGLQVGIASIVVGWLLVKQGMPVAVAVPATALLGAAIGLVSGLLITKARIGLVHRHARRQLAPRRVRHRHLRRRADPRDAQGILVVRHR